MTGDKVKSVLILDDESAIKENLNLFLEANGFHSWAYDCAESALEAIKSGNTFDIGIIDIRLPGINGEEFIMESIKLLPDMKFIIHTGSIDFELKQNLSTLGITEADIFKKPVVRIKDMISRIQYILDLN